MSQAKTDREQRLAEALRANLRRRKGQTRERNETIEPPVAEVVSSEAPETIPTGQE